MLYRLAQSEHVDDFILKGANLFYVWTGQLHRPTKDVDVLRQGPTDPELLTRIIEHCVTIDTLVDDGIIFETETIEAHPIRELELYTGVRVKLQARLGKARIPLQLDVGTGDAVAPAAEFVEYPSLLDDMPTAMLRAYRFETAIAEKCEAMVKLGMSNTRLKDFYDVFVLAKDQEFDDISLIEAIESTFARRGTPLSEHPPTAWTAEFGEDPRKTRQWSAFLKKSKLSAPPLVEVIDLVRAFLFPIYRSASTKTRLHARWSDGQWLTTTANEDKMTAELKSLGEGWYRLPLTDLRVAELSCFGTGKRPWMSLSLHEGPEFSMPYWRQINLTLNGALDVNVQAVDDGRVDTTITAPEDVVMIVEHFDVSLYDEVVEDMRAFMSRLLTEENHRGSDFGHIIHEARVALKRANT